MRRILQENIVAFQYYCLKGFFVYTIMCMGAGLHGRAVAEQYRPSSHYSVNVIIARHESSSTEAESHARVFFVSL